jgi:DNA-binding transcriptional LysR family regulator
MLHEIDLSRTDLNLLVLFETVMAERHVGRAAQRLNLSPSAVSHGLGRLREILHDPLFLRTPRGVVPSARALELATPVEEALARIRSVMESVEPFDAATSNRRFTIGAPDGASSVFLQPLLAALAKAAPLVSVSLKQLLPRPDVNLVQAWSETYESLDARSLDVAVLPFDEVPQRFKVLPFFEEEFVIAARKGHALATRPTLKRYCEMRHMVVSHSGDPHGYVDDVLKARGLSRRVELTTPNAMLALAALAETDFVCALPRRFVAMFGRRFGVEPIAVPLKLGPFKISIVAPKVAMMDAGVAWLAGVLGGIGTAWLKE